MDGLSSFPPVERRIRTCYLGCQGEKPHETARQLGVARISTMLVVPLSDIGEDGVFIDETVTAASLQPLDVDALPVGEVHVEGDLEDIGGDYLFRGNISGAFEADCDRCLKPAKMPFDVEVMWNFERDPKAAFQAVGIEIDEDADLSDSAMCRAITGDEIDLRPHVWEELVLAMPIKFLCREDCRGLCINCGADLNQGDCGCPEEDATPADAPAGNRGLAALGGMFPDLAKDAGAGKAEKPAN